MTYCGNFQSAIKIFRKREGEIEQGPPRHCIISLGGGRGESSTREAFTKRAPIKVGSTRLYRLASDKWTCKVVCSSGFKRKSWLIVPDCQKSFLSTEKRKWKSEAATPQCWNRGNQWKILVVLDVKMVVCFCGMYKISCCAHPWWFVDQLNVVSVAATQN